jgi:hypothetical protein
MPTNRPPSGKRAQRGARPAPRDEDLASLLHEVLTEEARHQGRPPPSAEESRQLLGQLLGAPHDPSRDR